TVRSLGLISNEVIHVSFVNPLGMIAVAHSMTFFGGRAGTRNSGALTTTSGVSCQPSAAHSIGGGAAFGSPCGAPPSTHLVIVSMSVCLSDRSLAKDPCCGSANHGGISRARTLNLIARAHRRACSYVSSDIGAIWPGRWPDWQFFCKIGRTSLVNVTGAPAASCALVVPVAISTPTPMRTRRIHP